MFIMSLQHAILGFLSWRPLTGYDLKKLIADSDLFPWSGNSNQIYTTLVALRRDGRVEVRTEQQESLPPRKIYSLTEAGRADLLAWVQSEPELPETRGTFLVQLAWADVLGAAALDGLIAAYERGVEGQVALCREQARRAEGCPGRTARERYLWRMAHESRRRAWEAELGWAHDLRRGLAEVQ